MGHVRFVDDFFAEARRAELFFAAGLRAGAFFALAFFAAVLFAAAFFAPAAFSKASSLGAPGLPGSRIVSPLPCAMRSCLAWMLA